MRLSPFVIVRLTVTDWCFAEKASFWCCTTILIQLKSHLIFCTKSVLSYIFQSRIVPRSFVTGHWLNKQLDLISCYAIWV